ncbi:MAG: GNAT family N-acetyltransferase [Acidaminococcaceae bacterium]|nr:GNAT family N-acetyltransferase [Acidaminococcaceae bacterium]
MDFRFIKKDMLPQIANLWDYCFEKKDSPFFAWYFSHYCLQQNKIIGGFDIEGNLATMLHLNPYKLSLHGRSFEVPYIVGVATDPMARGQHAMGELLSTAFTLLRASGTLFVILMPINAGIYLPYGFSYTYYRHGYKMPLKALTVKSTDVTLHLKRQELLKVKNELQSVYKAAMCKYNGYVERDERVWENYLTVSAAENLEAAVVYSGKEPVGYMIYSKTNGTFKIWELLTLEGQAKNRLLEYARGFVGEYTQLEWLAAPEDLSYLDFQEQSYTGEVTPFMMARIINVGKTLSSLTIPKNCPRKTFVLYVQDEFMPLNNVLVKITVTADGLLLDNSVDIPDVTMNIATLTQLYFGTFSVRQLLNNGKILAEQEDIVCLLEILFPIKNNFINEYF